MKRYTLQHDRPNCIGCGACAVIAPDYWEMADDGKSDIINGETLDNGWQQKVITAFDINLEAAESCPVEVIHIVDEETEEKII